MNSVYQVKINPNNLIIYNDFNFDMNSHFNRFSSEKFVVNKENLKTNKYPGIISEKGQKRIKRTVDYMLYTTKQKNLKLNSKQQKYLITFITLTLPSKQIHTDNEIKSKCLNQFLIELSNIGVQNYIWKAEKQKNKNIHFHIIVDKFIKWEIIREKWNRIVEKLNYVSQYRINQESKFVNGFVFDKKDSRSFSQQLKSYHYNVANGFINPNTTDIHKINKVKSLRSYIGKYISKKEVDVDNVVNGRVWMCSGVLSKLKGVNEIIDSKLDKEIEIILQNNQVYQNDFATIINFEIDNYKGFELWKLFHEYLKEPFKVYPKYYGTDNYSKLVNEFESNKVINEVQTMLNF